MYKREWERYTTLQVGEKEIVDVVQVEKSRREREREWIATRRNEDQGRSSGAQKPIPIYQMVIDINRALSSGFTKSLGGCK